MSHHLVDLVVIKGRSFRQIGFTCVVSNSWVAKLVARYNTGDYDAMTPQSRRPKTLPTGICIEIETAIIKIRKQLFGDGCDAGPATIRWHLQHQGFTVSSDSTIWRTLTRAEFITPQPKKRPYALYTRFEAALPNECW